MLVKRVLDAVFAGLARWPWSRCAFRCQLPVKLISSGPVLFRPRRCGLGGRLFACYKFRSMIAEAESRKTEVEHLDEKSGPAFKIRHDPGTTKVGQYLRRFSTDERP